MQALLLMYNLDKRASGALKVLCQKTRIRWREVTPAEYGLPLGALAGLAEAPDAPAAASPEMPFREPMLVMVNLMRPQFDALLSDMRRQGIRVPLKAVLTPTNVGWNSIQLRAELAREHEAVRRGESAPHIT